MRGIMAEQDEPLFEIEHRAAVNYDVPLYCAFAAVLIFMWL